MRLAATASARLAAGPAARTNACAAAPAALAAARAGSCHATKGACFSPPAAHTDGSAHASQVAGATLPHVLAGVSVAASSARASRARSVPHAASASVANAAASACAASCSTSAATSCASAARGASPGQMRRQRAAFRIVLQKPRGWDSSGATRAVRVGHAAHRAAQGHLRGQDAGGQRGQCQVGRSSLRSRSRSARQPVEVQGQSCRLLSRMRAERAAPRRTASPRRAPRRGHAHAAGYARPHPAPCAAHPPHARPRSACASRRARRSFSPPGCAHARLPARAPRAPCCCARWRCARVPRDAGSAAGGAGVVLLPVCGRPDVRGRGRGGRGASCCPHAAWKLVVRRCVR
jgi:hypothetical protein